MRFRSQCVQWLGSHALPIGSGQCHLGAKSPPGPLRLPADGRQATCCRRRRPHHTHVASKPMHVLLCVFAFDGLSQRASRHVTRPITDDKGRPLGKHALQIMLSVQRCSPQRPTTQSPSHPTHVQQVQSHPGCNARSGLHRNCYCVRRAASASRVRAFCKLQAVIAGQ